MSDYARQHDFSTKTGTIIYGSEVDDEFDALVTAVNSKVDESREASANGIATLGAGALIPAGVSTIPTSGGGQLPEASETALGAVELATSAEAITGTDTLRAITCATLDAVLENAGGMLGDIKDLADPAADQLLGWDDSANAVVGFTAGNGLEFNLTTIRIANSIAGTGLAEASGVISLSHLGIQSLVDPNADRIMFWDDSAGNTDWLTVSDGLQITATTLGIAAQAATSSNPVSFDGSGNLGFSLTGITTMAITDVDVTQDGVVMSDNGTIKVLPLDEAGVDIIESTVAQTFALADANTLQLLTGASAITWDIPTNAAAAFKIGTTIMVGSRDTATLTISPNTSAVTLTSKLRSDVGPTAGDHTVSAGGLALLVKVATNEWMITGDIG